MKILHIITSLKIGGAESSLYNLLQEFIKDKNDYHFVIYFHDGPNAEKIRKLGIPIFKNEGFLHKYDPYAYFKLKKLIKQINPNLIHSALWSANILARLIAKKLNIPIICDLHSNISYDGLFRTWLEKYFLYKADKYIAVSNSAMSGFYNSVILKEKNPIKRKIATNKLSLIYNGIDTKKTQTFNVKIEKTDYGINKNDFVFGSVGRLEPIKSYDLLIKSFHLLINKTKCSAKLCIIGNGSQKSKLQKLTTRLNINNQVIFLGEKNNAYKYYTLFNCFIISSKSEGLSIALLEALSFGLPIITTHNNQIHEAIKNGQNGLLVPTENKVALAKAMEKLCMNHKLCKNIKQNNLKLVKTKFNIYKTKKSYLELYYKIAQNSTCNQQIKFN
ncbi:glycosyltransferase [Candidatus Dependentiae bacterium]|nr:glycosyltransferase [Candidatus Dependentiae bacterium]